ncbi:phosphatidylserine decarboxylase [Lichtheimia corymbifera JMRC:FSU:9682]|uniref:Phosphatidylserine decarboxylase proenzyme 1, mitochondrial n=1 Tax=Lichtheimia corymbifera JMRC:FSU:9682 TaxID=1263082 RepID=A0A068S2F8_9FUNG|nr:phosphatidylserine decarboxylase [Lichtheimia corymbifera JMRC:FSU:9682]
MLPIRACRLRHYTASRCHITSRFTQRQWMHSQQQREKPLWERLQSAWNDTETKWYPIPVGLGLAVVGYVQIRHIRDREGNNQEQPKPKYVADGPWQVHVASALPLRTMSRLWGAFNSLTIPEALRPAGFKLYSWIFGCNLDEMKNPDLYAYKNLSEFFYRELKDGVRPIADSPLVSPSDGKVLHFGAVHEREIEQIKGVTYSLDALLGEDEPSTSPITEAEFSSHLPHYVDEEEFANVNGIPYSLDEMLGGESQHSVQVPSTVGPDGLAPSEKASAKDTKALIGVSDVKSGIPKHEHHVRPGNALFFCVIYLAPGDYHRFHSPTNWVVQKRRHFAGELFSVSPYFVKLLQNLFVLNERVVLLGKWKYGFFSMTPVGATNVGSIHINFDEALKTNRKEDLPLGTYTEVSYKSASKLLGGKPVRSGDEVGGFSLGSTVVLVFEAPASFQFKIHEGQTIKMGQALGDIVENNDKKA